MLTSSERVTSAAEGRALLASRESAEAVADRLQKLVVLTVPAMRMAARGARFTKIPWVMLASTVFTTGLTYRAGVREVQVLGALIAHRIEEATGQPADPALVKKLAVELYRRRGSGPISDRRLRLRRLLRRWMFRGALGRETGKAATKALDAAERLDVRSVVDRWATLA